MSGDRWLSKASNLLRRTIKPWSQGEAVKVAFKPVSPAVNDRRSPELYTPASYDDGYASQEQSRSFNGSISSKDSELYVSNNYYQCQAASPVESFRLQTRNKGEQLFSVQNYQAQIREKDEEIAKIRMTLEQNENAIIRVQEERKQEWENQMILLSQEYHRRLHLLNEQHSSREKEMKEAISQLEIINKQLLHDNKQYQTELWKTNGLSGELDDHVRKNSEISIKLSELLAECESLRCQIIELDKQNKLLQAEQLKGQAERDQLDIKANELEKKLEATNRHNKFKIDQLLYELSQKDLEVKSQQQEFEAERQQWTLEKNKVIQYQKQLQHTYVQMYRRNNDLERQLCRINARRLNFSEDAMESDSCERSIVKVDTESNPESFC